MEQVNLNNYFWQEGEIRLRAIELEDSETYYINRFDTEGRKQPAHGVELPPTKSEADKFVEESVRMFHEDQGYLFVIENIQGEEVGLAELTSINEKDGVFYAGIQVYRNYRRRGYGSAALKILLKYAFLERRLNRFSACVIGGNTAGAAFLEKLGCLKEGERAEMFYINGEYVSELYYGMLKDEFVNGIR